MLSRRNRIQEKKTTRKGLYLILASLALLAIFAIFGVQLIVKSSSFVRQFNKPTQVSNQDKTPPGTPQIDPFPPQYTKDNPITLNGKAEANSIAQIFVNDQKIKEVNVSDSSHFTFNVNLQLGSNKLYIITTDQSGNVSPQSSTYEIVYDNNPPILDISKPQQGASYYPPEQTISIEGKTEKDAQVTINDRMAIVNNDGSFSQRLKLNIGENEIKIISQDKAGNITERPIKVTYTQ
jgi:hypothetical protein